MAATIIATVGGATTNSYVTLAEAELYFETLPAVAAWVAATNDAKNRLLITAARVLDSCVQFNGYKADNAQAMQWPRAEARDPNQSGYTLPGAGSSLDLGYFAADAIPKGIKDAQCEMARFLLASNRTDDPQGTGIREFELTGTLRVAFESGNLARIIPDYVSNMILPFGNVIGGKSTTVNLIRA